MTEEQLRARFAANLTRYRKAAGLTQLELAESLNYSDKSISKWERGEGLPDLYVLVTLAERFGITVNDLLCEEKPTPKRPVHAHNRRIITLLALGLPWLAAMLSFFLLQIFLPDFPAWTFFIYAVAADAVVAVVFTKLWWHRVWVFVSASALIWTASTCVVVTLRFPKIALIYAVAGVLQILTGLWFLLKKR